MKKLKESDAGTTRPLASGRGADRLFAEVARILEDARRQTVCIVIGDALTCITFRLRPEDSDRNSGDTEVTGGNHDERDSRDSPVPASRALGL
jgi:hypothetical protein